MDRAKKQSIGLMVIAAAFVVVLGGVGVIMSMGSSLAAGDLVCPEYFEENIDTTAPTEKACEMDADDDYSCADGDSIYNGYCYGEKVDTPTCPGDGIYNSVSTKCEVTITDGDACPTDYTIDDADTTKCLGTPGVEKKCPNGYTEDDNDPNTCIKGVADVSYHCGLGELEGDKCYYKKVIFGSADYYWSRATIPTTPVTPGDTDDKDKDKDTTTNPKTGDTPIIIICVIALGALGYGAYKFRDVDAF